MIFYFSATGNSLFVAKELDSDEISISQIIHDEKLEFSDDSIGIVFPDYGSEAPYMVRDFLKKAKFHTDYLYMIMTYGCNNGASAKMMRTFCEEYGLHISYFHTIKMVDNYLPAFDMDKEKAMDKKITEQLEEIKKDIHNRKEYFEETSEEGQSVYDNYQSFTNEHPEMSWKNIHFSATASCIGCGICTKVCPVGCIQIVNGKALHREEGCQKCMACIHNCPENAIRMSIPEENENARFRNENVTLQQLIAANCQN